MKYLSVLSTLLFFIGCTSSFEPQAGAEELAFEPEDGMYLILNSGDSTLSAQSGAIITFSHHFLDENAAGQPSRFEIDTTEYVPLKLQKAPDSVMQPDGRMNLLISMTPDAGKQLEEFTGKNIKKRVALVIGGEAVSMHKIRSSIEGGRLQITRCTDNACEYLFYELIDNVAKEDLKSKS